ncbi:MAG: ATP-dependent Clp protease ATP-binding subunit [Bacilli bacterium]|nr:ATP-dependent Clp protease ATP-binding subunit [Bacilli bacterium]
MEESKFSILERYGENFTTKEYVTNPAIGRDKQIKELLLILLTPEKSAILIGKPGIGKTAIVEGLAFAIQEGRVPDALKGYTVINIKTASLLGTMPNGESKVQVMIDELKEKEKIILFIDEIHMLIGATDESSLDFANIFKEGLGRGSIKVVGATTTEEYERYILRDKAFTRRFQKVEVPEPTREETINIMLGTLPKIEKMTGAKLKYTDWIKEQIMGFMVDLTSEYKRVYEIGSRYPDISLTLLKQAFSHAVFDNRTEVNIFDVEDAILHTKNVYPDVIKKDMPTFYKMFDAIIKEEKGATDPQEVAPTWDTSVKTVTQPVYDNVEPDSPVQEPGADSVPVVENFERNTLIAPDKNDFSTVSANPDNIPEINIVESAPVQTAPVEDGLEINTKVTPEIVLESNTEDDGEEIELL